MMFITVSSRLYVFGALWAILGNIGFGASFVLLNAFLPVLVRNHPKLLYEEQFIRATTRIRVRAPNSDEDQSLLSSGDSDIIVEKSSPALALSTQISSYGIAIGYTAAVLLQIFAIVILLITGSSTWSLKLVLFCIGLWWLMFTIPPALWLRPRPGPPLPPLPRPAMNGSTPESLMVVDDRSWWGYVKYAWVGLGKTIMRARRLKDVMLFLAAWFLVSDGVATVSGTAVLFAKTVYLPCSRSPPPYAYINTRL
jgi:MFS transporter, UMF1 family